MSNKDKETFSYQGNIVGQAVDHLGEVRQLYCLTSRDILKLKVGEIRLKASQLKHASSLDSRAWEAL